MSLLCRELIGNLSVAPVDFAFHSYLAAQDCKASGSGASGLYWYGLDISSALTRAFKPKISSQILIALLKSTEKMNIFHSYTSRNLNGLFMAI